jgi:hypothetical protein
VEASRIQTLGPARGDIDAAAWAAAVSASAPAAGAASPATASPSAGQPATQEIHVIADNLSAHKTQQVTEFLDLHPTVHLHFTPTYSSWLNQVELWFAKIERAVIARGVFTSVSDLRRKLMQYIRQYNKAPQNHNVALPRSYPSRHSHSVVTIHWCPGPEVRYIIGPSLRAKRRNLVD